MDNVYGSQGAPTSVKTLVNSSSFLPLLLGNHLKRTSSKALRRKLENLKTSMSSFHGLILFLFPGRRSNSLTRHNSHDHDGLLWWNDEAASELKLRQEEDEAMASRSLRKVVSSTTPLVKSTVDRTKENLVVLYINYLLFPWVYLLVS